MKNQYQYGPVEIDHTKLRYVLYLRKSTDEKERQVRSIEDQEADCRELAKRIGLRVVDRLEEKKSAKIPGRPVFRELVNGLKEGRWDGFLAWHPDRLSRNMLEGGELIDLIDQGILKDLKFPLHHFTHDANGKMLLGMSFVLSKQYSDHLSEAVTRGVRGSHSEGESPAPKHGYYRNPDTNHYEPDGKNFELMLQGWQKRLKGLSLAEIATWMNSKSYGRKVKKKKGEEQRVIKMSKQILDRVFKDPFYYGVLVQAKQTVNLLELPAYDFTPMISSEEYEQVQMLSSKRPNPYNTKNKAFYPLKRMVECSYCGQFMVIAPSSGKGGRYLYARCDTEGCKRPKKSLRSKIIFDWIDAFLKDGLGLTEKEYNEYYENLSSLSDKKRQELSVDLHSLQARGKNLKQSIKQASIGSTRLNDTTMIAEVSAQVTEYKTELDLVNHQIEKLKEKLDTSTDDRLTIEEFLNLSKNAGAVVKAGDAVIKDVICRFIFLNIAVDEENVLCYQLKEPFATLLKNRVVLNGRRDRT